MSGCIVGRKDEENSNDNIHIRHTIYTWCRNSVLRVTIQWPIVKQTSSWHAWLRYLLLQQLHVATHSLTDLCQVRSAEPLGDPGNVSKVHILAQREKKFVVTTVTMVIGTTCPQKQQINSTRCDERPSLSYLAGLFWSVRYHHGVWWCKLTMHASSVCNLRKIHTCMIVLRMVTYRSNRGFPCSSLHDGHS